MELYSEAYKSRCIKRLKEWNAPVAGWICIDMYDVVEDGGDDTALSICELCDCSTVRYVHVMHHDEYFEDVKVGCICAGIMEGDILAAKERDREMKNRAKRKRNYLKREWQREGNGIYVLRYKNECLTIMPDQWGIADFGVVRKGRGVWHHKGKRIESFLAAVHAAFDLVDPPIVSKST